MAQCVIDPQSSLVLLLARRVNSAAGERGLRRSAMRNYSAPVVTACSIDPTTAPHQLLPTVAEPEGATTQIGQKTTGASKALRAKQ